MQLPLLNSYLVQSTFRSRSQQPKGIIYLVLDNVRPLLVPKLDSPLPTHVPSASNAPQLLVMSTTERQSTSLDLEKPSQLEKQDAVDWDGPNDPGSPLNWSQTKKNMHVIFVSIFTLYAYGLLPYYSGNWFTALGS